MNIKKCYKIEKWTTKCIKTLAETLDGKVRNGK